MNNADFKDTRILDAFDYIDPKYIAEVAESLKLRSVKSNTAAPEMTWRTPFKHWKQFVALAACLILLSMASPIANYVVEAVRSFAAGWGSVTETSELPETTNGMYDEYILTEEDLAELNYAYASFIKGAKYADSIEEAMTQKYGPVYIGKFGEGIVFVYVDNPSIDLYADSFWFCYESAIYSLDDAFEQGFVTNNDLNIINDIYERNIKIYSTRPH